MPEAQIAFIDPQAVLGALTAKLAGDLGPSAPHTDDDEPEQVEPIAGKIVRKVGLRLGAGPQVGVGEPHYTQALDQIWAEFDDPEERTVARLWTLLDEVADEAQRVHLLAQETWPKLPQHKVPDSERSRYDREFLAYLRRLNEYRDVLQELDPRSTATDRVYVGLVQRKQGAGPVPDCIMHMYFAQQLGILSDHADDMGEGFVGRVIDGLARVDQSIDEASEKITDFQERSAEKAAELWDRVTRPFLWGAAIFLGSLVVIGGTVTTVAIVRARSRKNEQRKELQP
jgi:hypothetical protein